jgi:hypothetical protein
LSTEVANARLLNRETSGGLGCLSAVGSRRASVLDTGEARAIISSKDGRRAGKSQDWQSQSEDSGKHLDVGKVKNWWESQLNAERVRQMKTGDGTTKDE